MGESKREEGLPRLWQATEEDSSPLLSLPEVVGALRAGLSHRRPTPLSWADVVGIGRKMKFPQASVDPEEENLSSQLWLLAAAWMKYRFPPLRPGDCIAFGRVVVAIAYRYPCLPGEEDERFARACEKARELLHSLNQEHAGMNLKVDLVLEMLKHHYDGLSWQWIR